MLPLLDATGAPLEDIVEGELRERLAFAGCKPLWTGELVEADSVSDDDAGENTLSSISIKNIKAKHLKSRQRLRQYQYLKSCILFFYF